MRFHYPDKRARTNVFQHTEGYRACIWLAPHHRALVRGHGATRRLAIADAQRQADALPRPVDQ